MSARNGWTVGIEAGVIDIDGAIESLVESMMSNIDWIPKGIGSCDIGGDETVGTVMIEWSLVGAVDPAGISVSLVRSVIAGIGEGCKNPDSSERIIAVLAPSPLAECVKGLLTECDVAVAMDAL